MDSDPFFEFARERHQIYIRRSRGQPWPWTTDPVLTEFSFTNVYRELDRTTVWLRENVRERLLLREILLGTVVFRWFNRIHTGEAIFLQLHDFYGRGRAQTAFGTFFETGDLEPMRQAILNYCGIGPYVTGAYIIKTPNDVDKLTGLMHCLRWFYDDEHRVDLPDGRVEMMNWQAMTNYLFQWDGLIPLSVVWGWLRRFYHLGDFMAYEVVTDLRHTPLLERAPDIMTWANPGPGAMRGLNRIVGRPLNQKEKKEIYNQEMQQLLEISRDPDVWPRDEDHPPLEMRDVEHTLCEFDKYRRVVEGQGRPRKKYTPRSAA